jgi:hypothetical protein
MFAPKKWPWAADDSIGGFVAIDALPVTIAKEFLIVAIDNRVDPEIETVGDWRFTDGCWGLVGVFEILHVF